MRPAARKLFAMKAPEPELPAEDGPAVSGVEEHLAALLRPQSFETDQYRALGQFVAQARTSTDAKLVAVTSPVAGDGKTTTAINLAAALAQSPGTRVLLVDTDLRRPLVASNLGLDSEGPGLAGAAVDPRLDTRALVRPCFDFSILPAGTPPDNPFQVLESPRIGELLAEARRDYDYVVLDTPPVLLVPDCKLMSRWVDGFLLVVAAHRTPRKLLGEALTAMGEAKVLGIVFNGDDRPFAGFYGKYYGRYYRERGGEDRGGWWRGKGNRQARPLPWR